MAIAPITFLPFLKKNANYTIGVTTEYIFFNLPINFLYQKNMHLHFYYNYTRHRYMVARVHLLLPSLFKEETACR
jgi:hypothetical protein